MVKVGFNVLAWTANVTEELFPTLDRIKKIGYDGVEFFVGGAESKNCQKVGQHAKELGLDVTTVTVVGKDTNPINASASIRAAGLDAIKTAIDRTHDLGGTLLCGPIHSAHNHFEAHPALDEEYKRAAEVLYQAGDYAQRAGIVLGPEALNRFECYLCNTMEQLARLLKETNHPNVRAMFDTHHANMEEKKFGNAIETIAPYLHHVHISENDRGTPGEGHIQFDDTFSALKKIGYSGYLTIEAFSRNDPDFANAIGVWREYNAPWDIAENGYTFIKMMCEKHQLS
jgi:D-psicose/D-tagatose/L-ribulose 3-epimerase